MSKRCNPVGGDGFVIGVDAIGVLLLGDGIGVWFFLLGGGSVKLVYR